ncbi:hypothetical protein E3P96_01506 [Wallemia ichthyophaga]|nr:hypothetical protein E3P96_01506 [Wallemia ichthyophaga]
MFTSKNKKASQKQKQKERERMEQNKENLPDTRTLPYLHNGRRESQDYTRNNTLGVGSTSLIDTLETIPSVSPDDKKYIKEPERTRKKPKRTKSAPPLTMHNFDTQSEASINELDRGDKYLKKVFFFHNSRWRLRRCYVMIGMTSLTYMVIGLNSSAIGGLIPQMGEYYDISEDDMSMCFLANFGGYLISTALSAFLIHHVRLRLVLTSASAIYFSGSLVATFAPPFAVFIVSLVLTGTGAGLLDVAATSVIMHYEDGPLLTVTYSFFSVGSMIAPFLVGGLRASNNKPWNLYFWLPVALSSLLMVLQWFVYASYQSPSEKRSGNDTSFRRLRFVLSDPFMLLTIILFFVMMGMQDSWSQWAVSYLERAKGMEGSLANINLACFWAGVTLSRLTLGHFINKWGDMKSAITLNLAFTFMMTGFWQIDDSLNYGPIVLNIFCGIFVGPLVPLILTTAVDRLPHTLKTTATSTVIAGGLIGSTVMPMSLGQAIHKFSEHIIPGVLIVVSFILLAGLLALFSMKYYRRTLSKKDISKTVHNHGSLAHEMRLNRRKLVHPPRINRQ